MKNACSHKCSNAQVVDGKLILSFPGARTPVVWQMDLTQTKASALEIRDNASGEYRLVVKTPRGEIMDVAVFSKKKEALNALMTASRALSKAHGQIRATSVANNNEDGPAVFSMPVSDKKPGAWTFVLCALLVLALLFLWKLLTTPMPSSEPAASTLNPAISTDNSGVPQSADEFLRNRQ